MNDYDNLFNALIVIGAIVLAALLIGGAYLTGYIGQ